MGPAPAKLHFRTNFDQLSPYLPHRQSLHLVYSRSKEQEDRPVSDRLAAAIAQVNLGWPDSPESPAGSNRNGWPDVIGITGRMTPEYAPVSRRNRKTQHLPDAVTRNPEMQCRRSRTHAVSTGQTDFPVKFHGENTPALPGVRKGKSGRLLRRPQPDHPAATVDEFCTAVLSTITCVIDTPQPL